MSKRVVLTAGLTALALGTAVAAAGALASLTLGTFGFSHALGDRARTLLDAAPSRPPLAVADALARTALSQSPYDNYARLLRAYVEARRLGRLGPVGVKALDESYALMPIDYSVAEWRIRFALQYWDQVTPATREAVRYEVLAFSKLPIQSVDVRAAITGVENPSGALAAAFLRREIDR